MPKEIKRRVQRHFPPTTIHTHFKPEVTYKASPSAVKIVFPLPELPLIERKNQSELPKNLIKKPDGEVGRLSRNGYNLETALGWSKDEYSKVQKAIREYAKEFLDLSQILSKQDKKSLSKLHKKAKDQHPVLLGYEGDWVTDDFLSTILKNSAVRSKGGAVTRSNKKSVKGNDDEDVQGETSGLSDVE